MSKRVVKKKVEEPAAPPPAEAKSSKSSIPPTASANPVNDVRVAQQMRVMEVVGANSSGEKSDKKYTPRTEKYIISLQPVLDHYEYSRADIAALVKRCHHDDLQIQIAVANVIEDRANHEADSWGEVKTKKQQKEAKKAKEEEEQREQERLEKELEKQRRDAEKRAAREAAAARKNGKNNWGADPAKLPPDPAILFAGAKPVDPNYSGGDDDWWESWGEWDEKGDGGDWNKENGKDWEWHKGQWEEEEWEGKGDEWWSGDWEKAGSGRGKRGAKEPRGRKGGANKAEQEPKDNGDIWDMPDISGDADKQATLDQWTLGDIRAYDGPGASRTEDESLGMPKVPPTGMRTVEEIESQHFGAGSPPSAPPMGLPPGKARIDSLFHQETNGLPPPKPLEDDEGKGKGKGKDKGKGKGKGKNKDGKDGERPERSERPRRERDSGDGDDGHDKPLERIDRSDDPRRQAIEEVGEHVTVKKHSSMGCAVISLRDPRVREAMLVILGERTTVAGTPVQLKPHFDKDTKIEVVTDIFAAWGRQAEKNNPLPERELMKFFEGKHAEIVASWREEAEEKQRADARAQQQKLLEEQQRQAQEQQREREDQRRVFEEQLKLADSQRLQAEAQRKALEDHARLQQSEQLRIQRESKAKYINDLQGNWAQTAGMLPGATGAAVDPRVAASLGATNATQQAALAAAQQQAQSRESASASGLNPAASAYTHGAQAQWQAQWMQAMYTQGAWQQQMAQQQMAQRSMQAQAQAAQQMAGQDYADQMRTQAAYYAYLQEAQRGNSAQQAAAYAQQQQQQQQGGYMGGQQQNSFGYNAAAAYGQQQQRGERI